MNDTSPYDVTQDHEASPLSQGAGSSLAPPQRIGRYRIEKVLGKGGFGLVYLAQDEQLNRSVAIKVPHAKLISKAEDAEAYLAEARTVANLDHANIVPVFDVGCTVDFPCYIVSKYVDGTDLSTRLRQKPFKYHEVAELVATVADALHYAHKQGLVHRDVKPSNILIGHDSKPYVVDFGLALREENIGRGPRYAGTAAYMSPEQARGEGHRVDGRSDIFSLGVVFYELLAGRQPFRGDTPAELLEHVTNYEPRPLRQFDEHLPQELERICYKALAKRASERYSTAKDLADDLRHFLDKRSVSPSGTSPGEMATAETHPSTLAATAADAISASPESMALRSRSDSRPVRIVPKGLRCFDAHDADFFLELLPGPYDRDGLPESLRFWKTRIEETDPDSTFSVGLVYGPSGCGKSSLIRAGLLPRLDESVIPVYIEATPEETETRLLHGLRKRCPGLEGQLTLKESLTAARRGHGIPPDKKVLIVLDQFEQWLHARPQQKQDELIQALRQCDGGRVQCLLLVRDDFWLAVSRFLRELEVHLLEGQNSVLVDLFDTDHAARVLTRFGQAFGRLPERLRDMSAEQREFVQTSVRGLSEDGKVICVRVALFAEMMKSRPWTMATLREVGGTKGVGFTFLEETFSASTGSAQHRFHQVAARAVLKALLPDSGSDIKGVMKSLDELLLVSGYASRPNDFDDLIQILDGELRLITPTDPAEVDAGDRSACERASGKYFQLSHDYLVHSLREWLNRKQKETHRGRAELLLAERSVLWNTTCENRFLPSFWEHAKVRFYSSPTQWTESQRKMMRQASRYHGLRAVGLVSLLAIILWGGLTVRHSILADKSRQENVIRAEGLVDSLLNAETSQVPGIVAELEHFRPWADPILKARYPDLPNDSSAKLHAALALLPSDPSQADFLARQLLRVSVVKLPVLCDGLKPSRDKICDSLWAVVQNDKHDGQERFQAACALAAFAPDDECWSGVAPFVTNHLVSEVSTLFLGQRLEQLRAVRTSLVPSLITAFRDHIVEHAKQRVIAATSLADYLNDQPELLAELILDADSPPSFSPLIEALRPHVLQVRSHLMTQAHTPLPADGTEQQRDEHLSRQAMSVVILIQLGYGDSLWSLLELSVDPSLRSYIIHYLGRMQTDPHLLLKQLASSTSLPIRRALVQALGGLDETRLPPSEQKDILDQFQRLYQLDTDAGMHGAALWAIRQYGAALPDLPAGLPQRSSEHELRIAGLAAKALSAKIELNECELESPQRQLAWERLQLERPLLAPFSLEDGLVARFSLNHDTEATVGVSRPALPAGVYQGSSSPNWVPGVLGQALHLDGNGSWINAGAVLDVERTDQFSYGCWFCTTQPVAMALLAKMEPPEKDHRGFDILLNQGLVQAHIKHLWPTNLLKVVAHPRVDDGAWHHVLVTYDGSSKAVGITIFLDGSPASVEVINDDLDGTIRNSLPLLIGSRGWRDHFHGEIDDVRLFNRLVHADEASQLYEAGIKFLATIPADERTAAQQDALRREYRRQDPKLQRLEQKVRIAERSLCEERWNGVRHWTTNSQGQHIVIIPNPARHGIPSLDYAFAICAHEVTVEQFRRFRERHTIELGAAAEPDCPVHLTSWYDAAAYCNWLSEQERIPRDQWCYEPSAKGDYAEGMQVKSDYLQLGGYRLPTLLEWECGCRAGTTSRHYFGDSPTLFDLYGWHAGNSKGQSHPVMSLLPNDLGLFDMHGNVWEWCQDAVGGSEIGTVNSRQNRMLSGGAFSLNRGTSDRLHTSERPVYRGTNIGFRLARTIPDGRGVPK